MGGKKNFSCVLIDIILWVLVFVAFLILNF